MVKYKTVMVKDGEHTHGVSVPMTKEEEAEERSKHKIFKFGDADSLKDSLDRQADSASSMGMSLVKRVTIPIILIIAGFFFLPFGALLWLLALIMMGGGSKK